MIRRREFLTTMSAAAAGTAIGAAGLRASEPAADHHKAQIAITLDLEMSRHYPQRGMTEWDYKKGLLDQATKEYSVEAARVAKEHGGLIHFFCVARVLEQPDIDWLTEIAEEGHPVGNHTYDHVNVHSRTPEEIQFRFRRAPWLIEDQSISEVIRNNISMTTTALEQRAGIKTNGFRTPGGFHQGLDGREDIQQMLMDLGYNWASAKYPPHEYGNPGEEPAPEVYESIVQAQQQAQPYVYPSGLIEIPMSPISDVGAFRSTHWKREWFLKATKLSVEWAIQNRAVFDFLAHPSCLVVEDPEFETIRLICDLVRDAGDQAEIVGLDQIAARIANG